MEIIEISKILSNKTRVDILRWLKEPEKNFPPHVEVEGFGDGVCVALIQKKAGLSQSTVSSYLSMMQRTGIVEATRLGKWTYYKRNEEVIRQYIGQLDREL